MSFVLSEFSPFLLGVRLEYTFLETPLYKMFENLRLPSKSLRKVLVTLFSRVKNQVPFCLKLLFPTI